MTRFEYDTYYVYELIDPRSKAVFYIGKSATPRARLEKHKSSAESSAYPRIQEIRAAGFEVEQYIIGQFNTEAEAFDYEYYLIGKTPGLVNLAGYHHPTEPFVRPVLAEGELVYASTENQPVPDEDLIIQALQVQLPHVPFEHIQAVIRAQVALLEADNEYPGVTDE